MKNSIFVHAPIVLTLALSAANAFAGQPQPTLVPVNNVSIEFKPGCTNSPRCEPGITVASFMVEAGGSCHSYVGKLESGANGPVLSILDYAMPGCTRPEQLNHQDAVVLGRQISGPIQLANPIYVNAK